MPYVPSTPPDWARIAVEDGVEIAYTEADPVGRWSSYRAGRCQRRCSSTSTSSWHRDIASSRSIPVATGDRRRRSVAIPTSARGWIWSYSSRSWASRDHLVGWSYGALACYAAIERSGTDGIRSLTVIDQTPKPLATGADDEWAETDLDGFLDDFLTPAVAEPDTFAIEFITWVTEPTLAPSKRRWLEAMHLSHHSTRRIAPRQRNAQRLSRHRPSTRLEPAVRELVREDWLDEISPWLSANIPHSVVWRAPPTWASERPAGSTRGS